MKLRKTLISGKRFVADDTYRKMDPSFRNIITTAIFLLDNNDGNMCGIIKISKPTFFHHLNVGDGEDIFSAFLKQYPDWMIYDAEEQELGLLIWPNMLVGDYSPKQNNYLKQQLSEVNSMEILKKMCRLNHHTKTAAYLERINQLNAEREQKKAFEMRLNAIDNGDVYNPNLAPSGVKNPETRKSIVATPPPSEVTVNQTVGDNTNTNTITNKIQDVGVVQNSSNFEPSPTEVLGVKNGDHELKRRPPQKQNSGPSGMIDFLLSYDLFGISELKKKIGPKHFKLLLEIDPAKYCITTSKAQLLVEWLEWVKQNRKCSKYNTANGLAKNVIEIISKYKIEEVRWMVKTAIDREYKTLAGSRDAFENRGKKEMANQPEEWPIVKGVSLHHFSEVPIDIDPETDKGRIWHYERLSNLIKNFKDATIRQRMGERFSSYPEAVYCDDDQMSKIIGGYKRLVEMYPRGAFNEVFNK